MNIGRVVAVGSLMGILVLALGPSMAAAEVLGPQGAMGTAFTYQGRLTDAGNPANGDYDFVFNLYDAASGGSQVGSTVKHSDVTVTDGLFTVVLDFGGSPFVGDARYLEVGVRPGSATGAYTTLSPRQPLTAAPYALYASSAPWSGLQGVPAGFADGVDNNTTYHAGEGMSLSHGTFSIASSYRLPQGCHKGQIAQWNSALWACADVTVPAHDHWGETWSGSGVGLVLQSSDDVALRVSGGGGTEYSGVSISAAGGDGLYVYSVGGDGVHVNTADDQGAYFGTVGDDGVYIYSAGNDGIHVHQADGDGVYANTTATNQEWGVYTPDKIYGGNVTAAAMVILAQVGDGGAVSVGEVVASVGLADVLPQEGSLMPKVQVATPGAQNLLGVVTGHMACMADDDPEGGDAPAIVWRSVEGPARPGDWVAVTVLGVVRVKIDPATASQLRVGQRMTVGDTVGAARGLRTTTVNGLQLAEGAPSIGHVLQLPEPGADTVVIFVTLR